MIFCLDQIWDLDTETKVWSSYDLPRAHQDSIWRLSWAHPEFGQIFASWFVIQFVYLFLCLIVCFIV